LLDMKGRVKPVFLLCPKKVLVSELTASLKYHQRPKLHLLFREKSSELGARTTTGTA